MGQILSDVTSVLDYKNSKQEADSKRKQILAEMSADEATKTNLVKKALSAQRAKYGAGGVSGINMTTGAVLDRIKSETSEPYDQKQRESMNKLKSAKNTKTPNLLKMFLKHFYCQRRETNYSQTFAMSGPYILQKILINFQPKFVFFESGFFS